jgi:hypothetical protein
VLFLCSSPYATNSHCIHAVLFSLLAITSRMTGNPIFESLLIRPTKRRVFVSYHHKDEEWRSEWERLFSAFFINHSVKPGEIDDSNSAEYIKRLIQVDYVTHASVMVVLIGPRTYCRKHVDWEISAALNKKLGGYSGLLGIFLPNHPNYGLATYTKSLVPPRLADNFDSGYSGSIDWTQDSNSVRKAVENAFAGRLSNSERIDNSRLQFMQNRCD